jgi:addiction module HigA family antidote
MDPFDPARRLPESPGEVLASFMEPYGISQNQLARSMGVPPRRINEILHGKRSISADTAIGLAEVFGWDAMFWMKVQARYDIALREIERARLGIRAADRERPGYWDEDAIEERDYQEARRQCRKLRASRGR